MLEQGKLEADSDSMKNLIKKTEHRSGQNLTDSEKILWNDGNFSLTSLTINRLKKVLNALKGSQQKFQLENLWTFKSLWGISHSAKSDCESLHLWTPWPGNRRRSAGIFFPDPIGTMSVRSLPRRNRSVFYIGDVEESQYNLMRFPFRSHGIDAIDVATAKEQAGRHKIKVNDLKQFWTTTEYPAGDWLSGRIASRFNDELVYTAGGYNAGPTNKTWLKTYNSASPEEFVEHIPFKKPRNMSKGLP